VVRARSLTSTLKTALRRQSARVPAHPPEGQDGVGCLETLGIQNTVDQRTRAGPRRTRERVRARCLAGRKGLQGNVVESRSRHRGLGSQRGNPNVDERILLYPSPSARVLCMDFCVFFSFTFNPRYLQCALTCPRCYLPIGEHPAAVED
jgi:hypothetical protein